ncbi:Crp/Fnr family transcriptional regulator [Nonomuraea sp. NPDC050310]|uniref:Crp/Fnr family transcriptional regulator n=1 Tax=Nonomuraea sp. NPDC050310 TaxID=3154935 RepID=UPI0033CDD1B8
MPEWWPAGTFMSRLGESAREDLLSLGSPRSFEPGDTLIHQGDRLRDEVYLLRSRTGSTACVKVWAYLENGAEALLGIRVSGDVVGELAALRGTPRVATVAACSPVLATVISAEAFRAYLTRWPEAWNAVLRMVADQLDWANNRRLDTAGYGVPARLARALGELAERYGQERPQGRDTGVDLTQLELGRLIGAGEDAVGKAVQELKKAGLVRSGYRRLFVTDVDGLSDFWGKDCRPDR